MLVKNHLGLKTGRRIRKATCPVLSYYQTWLCLSDCSLSSVQLCSMKLLHLFI